jgi:hypothetical protein
VEVVVAIAIVEVPDEPGLRETPVGVKEKVRLGSPGELVALRLILPVRPKLLRFAVELAPLPAVNVAGVAAWADIAKSGSTVTRTETV